MAFIEGVTLNGYTGEMVAGNYTKPTSGTGVSTGRFASGKVSVASTNKDTIGIGVALRRYAPVLSVLFASEDF